MEQADLGSQRQVHAPGLVPGVREPAPPDPLAARFRAVFENSRDAIGVSQAGVHLFVNPAYFELFRLPLGSNLEGTPVLQFIAPGSRDRISEYILRRARGEPAPATYETRGLRVDGIEFDMEVSVSTYLENGEKLTLAILRDITLRKLAEEEHAERRTLVQQIMDTADVAIFLVDKSGRVVHANRRMAEMFGRGMEELVGDEYVALVHPSEREIGRGKMLALLASDIPSVDLERLYWRKDGTEFWGHLAGRRFQDSCGTEVGLIGVITDIDTRKRSESALRQSEANYRRLYNDTPVLLHSIDRKGILVEVNNFWLKTLGYERDEVIGRRVTDFFTEASRRRAQEVVQPAFFRDGEVHEVPYQLVKKSGEVVDVLLSATAERDAAGTVVRSLAVIQNVTERKRLEQEILKSQRLESLGTLAGGIAHDFNNLLQGLFGYISLAKASLDQRERALALLDQAEKALHQSVALTSQLLTFSKGGKPLTRALALPTVIENAARFALSGSRVDFRLSCADDLRAVEADEGQIAQVIQNIVLNADQAMPLGGRIEISARNAAGPPSAAAGAFVEIVVRDSGAGIPAEHLPRIFDPYFSTKDGGSGLGLATSYSIIKNHGGFISVVSEPGRGSTFTVLIPASESTAATPHAWSPPLPSRLGRILVMDDEEIVRQVAGEALHSLGHDVEFCQNGEGAIEKFTAARAAGKPFDVVILDLTVRGGMGGLEAVGKLLEIDPAVKAVMSSGYSDLDASNYRQRGFRTFLKKPYLLSDLRDMVNSLLA